MMNNINYCWRIIATGFCFACFGLGALIISSIVFPIQFILCNPENRRNIARRTVQKMFYVFVRLMEIVGVLDVRLRGLEGIKQQRGVVVIANHPSLIDVVVMIAYLPNADCIVKADLFKNPFLKGVVKGVGYISNEDPELLIQDCKKSLALGHNIIIFPEGTRTVPGHELNFRRGAANIAIRCQANFLPILISVSPTTLTKQESWYNIPSKKVELDLQVLPLIDISNYYNEPNTSLAVRSLTREIQNYFIEELAPHG